MENSINKRFAVALQEAGITAADLSEALGIKLQAVYKYLKGESIPRVELLEKLVATYPEISMEYLVRGDGPKLYEMEEVISSTGDEGVVYQRVSKDRDCLQKLEAAERDLEAAGKEIAALKELVETQKGFIQALKRLAGEKE